MTSKLRSLFPMLQTRESLLQRIHSTPSLGSTFYSWKPEQQEEFLNFCTGIKGIKILYDSFFKEVINPEYAPERLEDFLTALLKRKVKILRTLPNDSTRIADETSLLITDIIVELEDGSIANVEIQKIGYNFPGERSACYSSDMLLRQYKRVRSEKSDDFSYKDIRTVFLIVIYEKSPHELHLLPDHYFHHSRQVFDTGLKLNLLQEYIMIPLDIFLENSKNKPIETQLDAWLTFLSTDDPDRIMELITSHPEFKPMYETLYQMCLNVEKVMNMFSEELRILDRNTTKYMIEEQQQEIDSLKAANQEKDALLDKKDAQLEQKDAQLEQMNAQIEELTRQLQALTK